MNVMEIQGTPIQIQGNHKLLEISRSNICTALGKDDDFLTPKRKRNVKE